MRGDYLFYEEKVETTQEERDAKAARRYVCAQRALLAVHLMLFLPELAEPQIPQPSCQCPLDEKTALPSPMALQNRLILLQSTFLDQMRVENGMSLHIFRYVPESLPSSGQIVTPSNQGNDYTRLPIIENYDYLCNICVPPGVFLSSKVISARMDRFSYYSDESEMEPSQAPSIYDRSPSTSSPMSSTSSSSPAAKSPARYHAPLSPLLSTERQPITLPPITALGHRDRRPVLPHPHSDSSHGWNASSNYTPLSKEDRRVLDRLRVVL